MSRRRRQPRSDGTGLSYEGALPTMADLPRFLGSSDVGRTWRVGIFWFVWTDQGWQQAIATKTMPGVR